MFQVQKETTFTAFQVWFATTDRCFTDITMSDHQSTTSSEYTHTHKY